MALIPKIPTGQLGKTVTSPEVIAIFSATFLSPFIAPMVQKLISQIPFLRDHTTTGLLLVSLGIFVIAIKFKGALRAVIIGVAGANFLIAVVPFVQQVLKR